MNLSKYENSTTVIHTNRSQTKVSQTLHPTVEDRILQCARTIYPVFVMSIEVLLATLQLLANRVSSVHNIFSWNCGSFALKILRIERIY